MRVSNGVASYAMNYFRRLNGQGIQFDFLIVNDVGSPYYLEIEEKNGKVYILPSYKKHPVKMFRYLNKIFDATHYDILHCNVMNSGSLILMIARRKCVPVRILHSHATQTGDKKWKEIRNKLFCSLSLRNANYFFSCSHLAGDYLFGKNNYYLIPNAIEIEKYSFKEDFREKLREKEKCSNKIVLMTVGRFTKQKNPEFIIEVIKSLKTITNNFILWWFGNGELEKYIKKKVEKENVTDYIKFWGANLHVNEYYSAADIFLLPSLYEGLPVVGIEAQVAGLPVLFSEYITKEVQISSRVKFLPIDDPLLWGTEICELVKLGRTKFLNEIDSDMYRIESQCDKLKNVYFELLLKEKGSVEN